MIYPCIVKVDYGMQSALTLCGMFRRRRRKPAPVLLTSEPLKVTEALRAVKVCPGCARVWGEAYQGFGGLYV